MLVFATSDKGGTGRSVTSSNILYQNALNGIDSCYVDFDFGSPTAGAMFGIDDLARGTRSGRGTQSYLMGRATEPEFCDIWLESDRAVLRKRGRSGARMVLVPGDMGGAEFVGGKDTVERCRNLFVRLEEEYGIVIVDLSAGRSYALNLVLAVTGGISPLFEDYRWLIYHRWTHQHVLAAHDLVYSERGILDIAVKHHQHSREDLLDHIRFVRTAVIDPNASPVSGLRPPQLAWLNESNKELQRLAGDLGLGRAMQLGSVPIDPVLQWHEQLITGDDVDNAQVANRATAQAFVDLAAKVRDDASWQRA